METFLIVVCLILSAFLSFLFGTLVGALSRDRKIKSVILKIANANAKKAEVLNRKASASSKLDAIAESTPKQKLQEIVDLAEQSGVLKGLAEISKELV